MLATGLQGQLGFLVRPWRPWLIEDSEDVRGAPVDASSSADAADLREPPAPFEGPNQVQGSLVGDPEPIRGEPGGHERILEEQIDDLDCTDHVV